jgi:hypothetical protein
LSTLGHTQSTFLLRIQDVSYSVAFGFQMPYPKSSIHAQNCSAFCFLVEDRSFSAALASLAYHAPWLRLSSPPVDPEIKSDRPSPLAFEPSKSQIVRALAPSKPDHGPPTPAWFWEQLRVARGLHTNRFPEHIYLRSASVAAKAGRSSPLTLVSCCR